MLSIGIFPFLLEYIYWFIMVFHHGNSHLQIEIRLIPYTSLFVPSFLPLPILQQLSMGFLKPYIHKTYFQISHPFLLSPPPFSPHPAALNYNHFDFLIWFIEIFVFNFSVEFFLSVCLLLSRIFQRPLYDRNCCGWNFCWLCRHSRACLEFYLWDWTCVLNRTVHLYRVFYITMIGLAQDSKKKTQDTFFGGTGLELRVSHLLGKHSTTWAALTPPSTPKTKIPLRTYSTGVGVPMRALLSKTGLGIMEAVPSPTGLHCSRTSIQMNWSDGGDHGHFSVLGSQWVAK
jgi:hypothetical protein